MEPLVVYMGILGGENEALSFENTYSWKDIQQKSITEMGPTPS
jgi:hypothetical protein